MREDHTDPFHPFLDLVEGQVGPTGQELALDEASKGEEQVELIEKYKAICDAVSNLRRDDPETKKAHEAFWKAMLRGNAAQVAQRVFRFTQNMRRTDRDEGTYLEAAFGPEVDRRAG